MGWIENRFEQNFIVTTVDQIFNWARKSSLWPLTFGLACCAIEMIASTTSRFDMARFGAEVFRPSPRQSDLMIVSGTVTLKMAPAIKRIWEQMPAPKWCISMAQQAKPKVSGQREDLRAQLKIWSTVVTMKFCSKRFSIQPIGLPRSLTELEPRRLIHYTSKGNRTTRRP